MKTKKTIFKTLGILICGLLVILIVLMLFLLVYRQVFRTKVLKSSQITTPNGIDKEYIVPINGIDQYLYIRGQDTNNPIILFLHGGPGSPMLPMVYKYQYELEKDYTVVNLEQRHAGKTYFLNENNAGEIQNNLSIATSVQDIYEVVSFLKETFNQDVIIMGHSWGSTLGALFVSQYPEMVKAYVGIGQNVSINAGERLIAEETLKLATGKDLETYKALASDETRYLFNNSNFDGKTFAMHRQISGKYLMKGLMSDLKFAWIAGLSPYYTLSEIGWYLKDGLTMQRRLLDELGTMDLRTTHLNFQVPVIMIMGEKDWVTPYPLAQEYFDMLQAPYTKMYYIENSGHSPMLENPEVFCTTILNALEEITPLI